MHYFIVKNKPKEQRFLNNRGNERLARRISTEEEYP